MLHKSFFISLLCAMALMLSSCGGGSGSSPVKGETYEVGTFSVLIPEEWGTTTFFEDGGVSKRTLNVYKGTESEWKSSKASYLRIRFYVDGKGVPLFTRSLYRETEDLQINIGKYTWTGYSGLSQSSPGNYDSPYILIWTDTGKDKVYIELSPARGEKKISLDDADVKAIITSITPTP